MERCITLMGLNHRTAGVEVRERFALSEACSPSTWGIPRSQTVDEALILSTCNRVEVLAVGQQPEALSTQIAQHWAATCRQPLDALMPHTYVLRDMEAIRHIFAVASSLDSMVLGEPQILGQLKDAYRFAVEAGTSRTILNRLLHKAFFVAKRVRTETTVAANAVSVSYAAVELAKRIFGDMQTHTAMLIGAGDMAELAATHLMQAGIRHMLVANRTLARAQELASQFAGEPVPFEQLLERLPEADIIISSTGAPEAIIRAADVTAVLKKRRQRPMFFIDIAVPRDIDPEINKLDNVYVYDIDDLKETVEENLMHRQHEASKAHAIVDEECGEFAQWLHALALQPTIVELVHRHEQYAEAELARTLKRLHIQDDATVDALRCMLASLVRKIDHDPIDFLKRNHDAANEAGAQAIDLTRRLFKLENS